MVTQELMEAAIQERSRQAAEIERQQQARRQIAPHEGRGATPRSGPSPSLVRRLHLPSFLVRAFRASSTS